MLPAVDVDGPTDELAPHRDADEVRGQVGPCRATTDEEPDRNPSATLSRRAATAAAPSSGVQPGFAARNSRRSSCDPAGRVGAGGPVGTITTWSSRCTTVPVTTTDLLL